MNKTIDCFRKNWGPCLQYGLPALFVLLLPLFTGFDYTLINILLYIEIYMVLALGLNVVVGYTGLLDLGYVSFMAMGAVITAQLLVLTVRADTGALVLPLGRTEIPPGSHPFIFPFSVFLIMAASGAACAIIGLLRGIPTLRLSGDYFAIVTLGIAEIIFLFLFNEEWFSGAAFAIKLTDKTRPELFGEALYWDTPHFFYLTFGVLALTIVAVHFLSSSRLGRAFAAIRLDETAARACGVNVSRYKMIAFAISGFIGGVGGSLYALWMGTVAVRSLEVWQSFLILSCVVLGGMGSIRGVMLGTAILMFIGELLRYELGPLGRVPPEARYLVFGILIIVLMRVRPMGLIPARTRTFEIDANTLEGLRETESPLFKLGTNAQAQKAPAQDRGAAEGGRA